MSDLTIYDLIGKRVKLIEMFEDPTPIKPGTKGTVTSVGADVINVKWDNGRVLGMIWGIDHFEIIDQSKLVVYIHINQKMIKMKKLIIALVLVVLVGTSCSRGITPFQAANGKAKCGRYLR